MMPPIYTEKTIHTGIHDFKTNISRYIRELNTGRYEQVILSSRGKPIGGFYTFEGNDKRDKQTRLKELSGLLNGSEHPLAGLISGLAELQDKG